MAEEEPTQWIPIDPTLTAIENFFAIINAKNTKQVLGPQHVTWADPVPYHNEEEEPNENGVRRNTEVILTARPAARWFGPAPVRYHRVELAAMGPEVLYEYGQNETLAQIHAALTSDLRMIASEVQFDVTELPQNPPSDGVVVNLVAQDSSLLYLGSLPVRLQSAIPANARLDEAGNVRYLEDGSIRIQDSAA